MVLVHVRGVTVTLCDRIWHVISRSGVVISTILTAISDLLTYYSSNYFIKASWSRL